ncbi:hypothetical protein [Novosphingobium sp. ST904]|uniref:hypothetical protein n=1 Tax=Novosphingobium sp. ST904 TaxID=1684385 RepID=UPI0010E90A8B|nr:hypothetical protein [Novosphingobium sp. ST904]TCM37382.1 hypothetical protein EDF59_11190 [Novosphingobium sp. ST904]
MKARHPSMGRTSLLLAGMGAALLLAGCDSHEKKPVDEASDPALAGGLGDRIVVDPEMTGGRNPAPAASGNGIVLPAAARSPEAVAAAKKAAAEAAGGALGAAPATQKGSASPLAEGAASAARVTQASRAAKTDCAGKVRYSDSWATKLPAALPVYPRGAVQEAAGTDTEGCALRVVNYGTAVSPADVISFYYAMAQKGGYSAEYRVDGADHAIGGRKGALAYVVYARKLANGVTEVDLVTSGQ